MAAVQWRGYTVSTKDSLADASWTDEPDLRCEQLTIGVAPTMDQARLTWHFGIITREGAAGPAYVPKRAWRGKYVRIRLAGFARDWVGYVVADKYERWPEEDDGQGGKRLSGGTQQLTAVGLEWFLTRAMIAGSVVYDGVRIDRALGYNTGWGDGRDLSYRDRGNKDTRGTQFAADKDHRTTWAAGDIVANLLERHQTTDKNGAALPAEFRLHIDAYQYLQWFRPTVETAGHSVYQVLNQIIAPARGLVWWIEWAPGSQGVGLDHTKYYPLVRVTSMASSVIPLAGGDDLLANGSQKALPNLDSDPALIRVEITKDDSRRADQVIVRGAFRRAVFTVSIAAGNLEPGWLPAEEAAYIAAASAEPDYPAGAKDRKRRNDRVREAQRFERVYQVFQIPTDWNGEVDAGVFACPLFYQGSASVQGAEKVVLPGLRLSRSLPILTGYDYADATNPTPRDPANTEGEWQRPFAVVDAGEASHGWRFAHAVNTTDDETTGDKLTSYHMAILAGSAAFQLTPGGGMPHALAKNHFDPNTAAPSNYTPEVDYADVRATVCAEWDAYCEARWPFNTAALPADKALTRVYVSLGDRARFDWLAAGTVYDVQDGVLKQTTTAGALRDDRELCEQVARIAYDWYAEDRGEVMLEWATLEDRLGLGDLITTIGNGAAAETVKAIVSQITYGCEEGRTLLTAGFAELDFARLL